MQKSLAYLKKLLKLNDTIVVGVSGGPDSMCLLSLLEELVSTYKLKIIVCHINHNVREESLEEENYVRKYSMKHGFIFEYKKLDCLQGNFEAEARKERYNFFLEMAKKYKAEYIMTAHHGDDLVESICMRLLRGSNLSGYKGISLKRKWEDCYLVRPLLFYTKKDIVEYLEKKNIKYYIDKTNLEDIHLRNRIRLNILPLLKKENKNVHEKFLQFSKELESVDDFLQNYTNNCLEKCYLNNELNISLFLKEDKVIQKRILEEIMHQEYRSNLYLITNKHLEEINKLILSKKVNSSLNLPMNKVLVKSYNKLFFKEEEKLEMGKWLLEDRVEKNDQIIEKVMDSRDTTNFTTRLLSSEITLPLYVRTRNIGDKVSFKNSKGSKKLKDVFIDSKVEKNKRDTQLLVVDSNDEILWVPGLKKTKFDKEINEKYDIILEYKKEGEKHE